MSDHVTRKIRLPRTWVRGGLIYTQVGPYEVQVSRGQESPPLSHGETRAITDGACYLGCIGEILATAPEAER